MARKRYSDEDILKLLREIELNLTGWHSPPFCLARRYSSPSTGIVRLNELVSIYPQTQSFRQRKADATRQGQRCGSA